MSKFRVDWIKTQGEIASKKTCTNNKFKEANKIQYSPNRPIITKWICRNFCPVMVEKNGQI